MLTELIQAATIIDSVVSERMKVYEACLLYTSSSFPDHFQPGVRPGQDRQFRRKPQDRGRIPENNKNKDGRCLPLAVLFLSLIHI